MVGRIMQRTAAPPRSGPARSRRLPVLLVVGVGVFMSSLDLFIVNIAFPAIHQQYATSSLSDLSWVLSAYAIVFAALLVVAGRSADALGRKRSFLAGMVVFTAASAACAVAPSVLVMVIARCVQAAGAALMVPASLGLLLPEFPPHKRQIAIGVWAATGGVAAAAGPPLGGLLVQASWRWVFLVNVPIGVVTVVTGWLILREIRYPDNQHADFAGAALLIGGVGALVLAIVQGQDWGWTSLRILGLLALAVVAVVAVGWRSSRHPAPIVEPALVRVRAFRVATAASVLFFMGFAAMLLGTILFLTTVWHESTLTAGLMIAPGPATAAAFAIPGARLSTRIGPAATGAIGALIVAIGGAWWALRLGGNPNFVGDFLPGMSIGGVGVGLVLPSLTGAAAAGLPPERLATGIAVQTTGRQIGSALGVAVVVALLAAPHTAADFRIFHR